MQDQSTIGFGHVFNDLKGRDRAAGPFFGLFPGQGRSASVRRARSQPSRRHSLRVPASRASSAVLNAASADGSASVTAHHVIPAASQRSSA